MWFRNLTLFRLPADLIADVRASLDACIAEHPLREPGPLEERTIGFVSPLGRGSDVLARWCGTDLALICVGGLDRNLPAPVVAEELAKRIAAIAERESRRVGGRERKRLKESVFKDLLPRAFPKPWRVAAYLDFADGWLVVDTASRKAAEAVVGQLREALGQFPVTPMAPAESPRAVMTDWLAHAKAPACYALGDEAELRDPVEHGAAARVVRQDLVADEVHEHLRTGKQVYKLGLSFDDRMSFVLSDDLAVRKLRFLDAVFDEIGDDLDSREAELDARFALMTLELRRLLAAFAEQFGIEQVPAMRLDAAPTPKSMRDAERIPAELAIRISADLYRAREAARRALGDRYAETMHAVAAHIRAEMPEHQGSELKAAMAIAKRQVGGGLDQRLVLAAAVEMLEPSPTT